LREARREAGNIVFPLLERSRAMSKPIFVYASLLERSRVPYCRLSWTHENICLLHYVQNSTKREN
jgi:hypothetical protein